MDEATKIKPALDQPRFTLQWEGDKEPSEPVSLEMVLDANAEDAELCEWARSAPLDSGRICSGGAAPMCSIRRVS